MTGEIGLNCSVCLLNYMMKIIYSLDEHCCSYKLMIN